MSCWSSTDFITFDGCLETGTGSLVGLKFPVPYGASTNVEQQGDSFLPSSLRRDT